MTTRYEWLLKRLEIADAELYVRRERAKLRAAKIRRARIREQAHKYNAQVAELRPIMAAKGWKFVAGCWVPRKG